MRYLEPVYLRRQIGTCRHFMKQHDLIALCELFRLPTSTLLISVIRALVFHLVLNFVLTIMLTFDAQITIKKASQY